MVLLSLRLTHLLSVCKLFPKVPQNWPLTCFLDVLFTNVNLELKLEMPEMLFLLSGMRVYLFPVNHSAW